ncbi:histidinol phosphate phosphatase domain-containing protein [Maridesulfovibrio ferrireducens]|uniref:histidinol phosphate phosphatase domain-containing protein n=1 Tax=Maridesulfovibrio ferrireducens TaxID=246191 RepID=UPI001A357615|nr:histidinol phosphate phosphatase domain-containing protein [Maridesulfovibrio ferrireducens]MBI9110529.1 histidinol phosphate phosphatase domain-containing protein [Maridesulfovibrio ferrireducens]
MIDFHTHTVFSDGELIPAELARRARIAGYRALAMTDHADSSNIEIILENIHRFAKKHGHFFDIDVFSGVELTHVPPGLIGEMVDQARDLGAQIVVVHGETIVEPVAEGTNLSAIEAKVDILAHPGLVTEVEVKLAAEYGVHLEITTRKGHSLTNGHVVALARKFGAKLVINNDAHAPGDLVSREIRRKIALGAGMTPQEYEQSEENSRQLVQQMMKRGS